LLALQNLQPKILTGCQRLDNAPGPGSSRWRIARLASPGS